jgi:hypothetical protein
VITEAEIEEVLDRIIRLSTRYGYPVAREPDTDTRTALNRMLDTAQPNRLVDDFESLAGPWCGQGHARHRARPIQHSRSGPGGQLHPKTTITRRVLTAAIDDVLAQLAAAGLVRRRPRRTGDGCPAVSASDVRGAGPV